MVVVDVVEWVVVCVFVVYDYECCGVFVEVFVDVWVVCFFVYGVQVVFVQDCFDFVEM